MSPMTTTASTTDDAAADDDDYDIMIRSVMFDELRVAQ